MTPTLAAETAATEAVGHQAQHEVMDGHSGHGEDHPTAKPCCSACGPTLPADPVGFAAREKVRGAPAEVRIRTLATRPPFPAYDATGPPPRI
ncbi:MAG: hypothetical protein ACX930_04605 [Erythrobacter sp.]